MKKEKTSKGETLLIIGIIILWLTFVIWASWDTLMNY